MNRLEDIEDREENLYRYSDHHFIYADVRWLTSKLRECEKGLAIILTEINKARELIRSIQEKK